MILRTQLFWLLAALLLGACGTPDRAAAPASLAAPTAALPAVLASPMPKPPTSGEWLYAGVMRDTPVLMAIQSGVPSRELPLGTRSPDGATLYVAATETDRGTPTTRLQAIDIASGNTLRETSVAGAYVLPTIGPTETPGGLSPNGRWLALEAAPDQPQASASKQLVVLDTAFERPPREALLDGAFWFDGLSDDGNKLYLIEYLDEQPRKHYRVRLYHLASGQLDPAIIADKRNGEQVMGGVRQDALASHDGAWLFSLYLDDDHGPFIHALNLSDRYAICIDLPTQAKEDAATQRLWSLAMSADGAMLYAANGGLGLVAEIGGADLTVRRVSELPDLPTSSDKRPEWSGDAALSPDSKTLFVIGGQGVLAVDTRNPKQYRTFFADRILRGLAVSADGARLYAVDGARSTIVQAQAASGVIVSEIGGAGDLSGLLWAEQATGR